MSRAASLGQIRKTADLFCGQPGLDAEIVLLTDRVRIRQLEAGSGKHVDTTYVDLDHGETIYVDGAITLLEGALRGVLTIFGNRSVSITGAIRCIDEGTLRVIGRNDVTGNPSDAWVSLLSTEGRVLTADS